MEADSEVRVAGRECWTSPLPPLVLPSGLSPHTLARLVTNLLYRKAYHHPHPWAQWLLLSAVAVMDDRPAPHLLPSDLTILQQVGSQGQMQVEEDELEEEEVQKVKEEMKRLKEVIVSSICQESDMINKDSVNCQNDKHKGADVMGDTLISGEILTSDSGLRAKNNLFCQSRLQEDPVCSIGPSDSPLTVENEIGDVAQNNRYVSVYDFQNVNVKAYMSVSQGNTKKNVVGTTKKEDKVTDMENQHPDSLEYSRLLMEGEIQSPSPRLGRRNSSIPFEHWKKAKRNTKVHGAELQKPASRSIATSAFEAKKASPTCESFRNVEIRSSPFCLSGKKLNLNASSLPQTMPIISDCTPLPSKSSIHTMSELSKAYSHERDVENCFIPVENISKNMEKLVMNVKAENPPPKNGTVQGSASPDKNKNKKELNKEKKKRERLNETTLNHLTVSHVFASVNSSRLTTGAASQARQADACIQVTPRSLNAIHTKWTQTRRSCRHIKTQTLDKTKSSVEVGIQVGHSYHPKRDSEAQTILVYKREAGIQTEKKNERSARSCEREKWKLKKLSDRNRYAEKMHKKYLSAKNEEEKIGSVPLFHGRRLLGVDTAEKPCIIPLEPKCSEESKYDPRCCVELEEADAELN